MRAISSLLAILGAAAAWSGLGVQLYILVTGTLGPIGGAWRFFAFFTILMNLFAACLFTAAIARPLLSATRVWLHTAAAVYMTVGGATYVLILQNLWDPQGLQLVADVLLHYAAPALAILFWFVGVPKTPFKWSEPLLWAGGPLVYFVYALARAAFDGFYPYPFIDVSQLGWARVLMNALVVLVAFVGVGLVYTALARALSRRQTAPATS